MRSNKEEGSPQGPIYRLLADDHAQLDRLLDEAGARDPAKVGPAPPTTLFAAVC